jgi:hypothetical protein
MLQRQAREFKVLHKLWRLGCTSIGTHRGVTVALILLCKILNLYEAPKRTVR